MAFLRLAEVFPVILRPASGAVSLERAGERFVESVSRVSSYADSFMVADMKDPKVVKVSAVASAALLRERAGLDAFPVLVARDVNRPAMRSSVLTTLLLGISSMAMMWGDALPPSAGGKNVYDYDSLASAISDAKALMKRVGVRGRIYAPVNLARLHDGEERARARGRLTAGADLLLAQPPSSTLEVLREQRSAIDSSGLSGKVLPGVFPFKDAADLEWCRDFFGWEPPASLTRVAKGGGEALLAEARRVIGAIRDAGFPGVYVSTRGTPSLLQKMLG
jgi:5,10-methylenetetrahydrofolate reductase